MKSSPFFQSGWRLIVTSLVSLLQLWFFAPALLANTPPLLLKVPTDSAENPQPARNITTLSYLPGYPTGSIQIADEWAYLGMGSELVALNITDPATPRVAGHVAIPGLSPNYVPPAPLVLQANYAFIATDKQLYAVNLADPTQLRLVGSFAFTDYISDLAVVDQRLVVSSGTRLWVIDSREPAAMQVIGYWDNPWPISSIAIAENKAYVVAHGLNVLDFSTAAGPNPSLLARLELNNATKVLITATRAYLLNSLSYSSVTVVDITAPTAPVVMGTYQHRSSGGGDGFTDAAILNDQLFIVNGAEIQVIDFSNPASAQKILTVPQPASRSIPSVHIAGGQLYVTDEAIRIFDLSTAGSLAEIGRYTATFQEANDILVQDQVAYVADTAGLSIFNVLTPTLPQWTAYLTHPAIGNLYELAINQKMLYATDSSNLYAIDVTNPVSPQVTAIYPTPSYHVAAGDKLVFVAETINEETNLVILDATNPNVLQPIGKQELPYRLGDIAAAGHYVYVTDQAYLHVIDVHNPTAPVVVARYMGIQQPQGKLNLSGHYVYMQTGSAQISIIDIVNPTKPIFVSDVQYPPSWPHQNAKEAWIADLAIEGDYLYLADQFNGVLILDITNLQHPFEVGRYAARATNRALAVVNQQLFMAQEKAGVAILAFQPPVTTTTLDSAGGHFAVVRGGVVYTFPPGTLSAATLLTHTTRYLDDGATTLGNLVAIQPGFTITATTSGAPAPIQAIQPYTMQIQYASDQLGPAIESTLALYAWSGTQWQKEATSTLDLVNHQVVATPTRFALWAILGQTNSRYLPLIFDPGQPE